MVAQAFIRIAIPVLYVYDEGEVPEDVPGFSMSILPVISRSLKEHAGTAKVTVITGTPAPTNMLEDAFTHLALQYAHLEKASPEAGALLAAEFIAENFDGEVVLGHLKRILEEQQRELAQDIESRFGRGEVPPFVPPEETASEAVGEEEPEAEQVPEGERGEEEPGKE